MSVFKVRAFLEQEGNRTFLLNCWKCVDWVCLSFIEKYSHASGEAGTQHKQEQVERMDN